MTTAAVQLVPLADQIACIEREIGYRLRAGEMPGGWTAELESQIAARHAERERREAAETLLRRGYTTAELVAHFARYKD